MLSTNLPETSGDAVVSTHESLTQWEPVPVGVQEQGNHSPSVDTALSKDNVKMAAPLPNQEGP